MSEPAYDDSTSDSRDSKSLSPRTSLRAKGFIRVTHGAEIESGSDSSAAGADVGTTGQDGNRSSGRRASMPSRSAATIEDSIAQRTELAVRVRAT